MRALVAVLMMLALPAAAAPRNDRQDALDFSNGAWLVQDEGSYGAPLGSWSAWNLTDGSDATGWSSAEHKPTGAKFVWELDTTWRLDTFAVSTLNMQEGGYPGISAKTVELSIANG